VIQRIEDEERRLEEKKKDQASREMEAAAREDVKEYVEKDEELAKTNDEIVKIKQEIESLPTREEMTDILQKVTRLEEEKEEQIKDFNALKENFPPQTKVMDEEVNAKHVALLEEQTKEIPILQKTIKDANATCASKEEEYNNKLATLEEQHEKSVK